MFRFLGLYFRLFFFGSFVLLTNFSCFLYLILNRRFCSCYDSFSTLKRKHDWTCVDRSYLDFMPNGGCCEHIYEPDSKIEYWLTKDRIVIIRTFLNLFF
jgi:hypothetical protein